MAKWFIPNELLCAHESHSRSSMLIFQKLPAVGMEQLYYLDDIKLLEVSWGKPALSILQFSLSYSTSEEPGGHCTASVTELGAGGAAGGIFDGVSVSQIPEINSGPAGVEPKRKVKPV